MVALGPGSTTLPIFIDGHLCLVHTEILDVTAVAPDEHSSFWALNRKGWRRVGTLLPLLAYVIERLELDNIPAFGFQFHSIAVRFGEGDFYLSLKTYLSTTNLRRHLESAFGS